MIIDLIIQAFDSMGFSVVIFNSEFRPVALSNSAGDLFRINCKDDLAKHEVCFRQIIDLLPIVENSTQSVTSSVFSYQRTPAITREINIESSNKRLLSVLANVSSLSFVDDSTKAVTILFLALLHDLSLIEPVVDGLESMRRMRPFVISTACDTGKSFAGIVSDHLFAHVSSHIASKPTLTTDLQQSLNDSIALVDPIFPASVKLSVNAHSSALLAMQELDARKLFCYVLLEAADFVSPRGMVNLRITLPITTNHEQVAKQSPTQEQDTTKIERPCVAISIHCQKDLESVRRLGYIERYVLRRVFPKRYKARKTETHDNAGTATNLETVSENLKFALAIVNEYRATLQIQVPKDDLLVINISVPIVHTKIPM